MIVVDCLQSQHPESLRVWLLMLMGSRLRTDHGCDLCMFVSRIDDARHNTSMLHVRRGEAVLSKQIQKPQSLSNECEGQLTTTIVL